MTNGTKFFHLVCLLAVMLTMAQPHSLTYAQAPVKPTTIKGVVVDSLTREPIPFAMVLLQGSSAGTQADADGRFDITTKVNFLCANFSMMGYTPKDVYVRKGDVNDLTIELSADGVALKRIRCATRQGTLFPQKQPSRSVYGETARHERKIRPPQPRLLQLRQI